MPVKPLNELQPGEKGKVAKIGLKGKFRLKLMDMGMVRGTEVEVLGIAPLGDPMEIKIKGFNLSIRKNEANLILIETV
ncbi:MAG: ferrous iron transport protein A [Dehalococcoidales bacterium]|jgi:Fe2+ transport system protein FeoA|nr:ferrous iron transport protein A [Dehalococcoidales bacterium]MDD3264324.1 ferrous iron transport protein A [Dehalococcoidales bacterium]MDD4322055.1 ferrous iron transport protein A [Dehalococcoidales bacterium]MDD4793626.1 ferrous iron transport protein A [Dehalococcoidales bacterium]MDD5122001.1 ferrous iron transport protein A [Dehalococcoidales bacterium]